MATVENTRDDEIADVRFSVDFYDGDTEIGSGWTMPPFPGSDEYAEVSIAPTHVDNHDRISRVGVSTTIRVDPLTPLNSGEVAVSDVSADLAAEQLTVSSRVENVSDNQLDRVYIHVNFYDGDELVDWQHDGLSRLAAGDAGEWTVQTSQGVDGSRIEDYKYCVTDQRSD
ncbi:FxLYD domain-containing protein [Natrinema salifodinae]|uniref:FxLYD domain-containing protein n=1 Tax=Natrinema salifodinae TaxID=1202768 RepID=UPI000678BCCB|nr:FxLYD domain-containing protein [Natrinema salifodinae]